LTSRTGIIDRGNILTESSAVRTPVLHVFSLDFPFFKKSVFFEICFFNSTLLDKRLTKDMHIKRQHQTFETLSASSIPSSFPEALDTCFGGELIEVCESDSYIGVGCRAKRIERKPPPQTRPESGNSTNWKVLALD